MCLPIIFNLFKILKDPDRVYDYEEYVCAIFNQFYIPVLGVKSTFKPTEENRKLHWRYRVI